MSVDNSVPTPRGDERRAADVRPGFFSKARIIARPGFNRWLVPPAALAIHLCIGMAYGFSVFWLPLSQALGAARRRPVRRRCPPGKSSLPPGATGASPCWAGPIPSFYLSGLFGGAVGKLAGEGGAT